MPAPKHSIRAEHGAPADALGSASRRRPVDLIVLSADHALLAVIQSAAEGELLFWPAATADAVVEHLVSGRCGILLVDLVHLRGEIAVLLTRLVTQFPHLVLMVAGRREDEGAVAQLLSGGVIYRYLHKPISPGRAQQFLNAAIRRHRQLNEREPIGLATVRELVRARLWQQLFKHSVRAAGVIGGIAAAVVIVSSLRHAAQPKPEMAEPTQQAGVASVTSLTPQVSARQVVPQPQTQQTQRAPNPPIGPTKGLEQQLQDAQRLIEAGRLNDAMRAIRKAATGAPDDARIAIIATTIGEQLLTRASAALAEGNFELAQRRLDAAQGLDTELNLALPDLQAGIDALEHARSTAQTRALAAILDVARARREAGALIEPAGASAYEQLQLARTQSPTAEVVLAETQALALACIDAAERALADHRFDTARTLLDRVDTLVPSMSAARALRREIELMQGPAEPEQAAR